LEHEYCKYFTEISLYQVEIEQIQIAYWTGEAGIYHVDAKQYNEQSRFPLTLTSQDNYRFTVTTYMNYQLNYTAAI